MKAVGITHVGIIHSPLKFLGFFFNTILFKKIVTVGGCNSIKTAGHYAQMQLACKMGKCFGVTNYQNHSSKRKLFFELVVGFTRAVSTVASLLVDPSSNPIRTRALHVDWVFPPTSKT